MTRRREGLGGRESNLKTSMDAGDVHGRRWKGVAGKKPIDKGRG